MTYLLKDQSVLPASFDYEIFMEKRMENDANGNPIYVGWAQPGTAEGDLEWFIIKITYDANQAVIHSQVANNIPRFKYSWTLRATYF
jgi:hypothetical protein